MHGGDELHFHDENYFIECLYLVGIEFPRQVIVRLACAGDFHWNEQDPFYSRRLLRSWLASDLTPRDVR